MHSIPPKQTVANSGRVTPAKEVGDVLGLSNIMAMVSPSTWKSKDDAPKNSNPNSNRKAVDKSTIKPRDAPSAGIQKIIAALGSGSTAVRPANLSREECILWDSLQTTMANDRNEHMSKRRALEEDLEKTSALFADMEQKYAALSIVVENQQSRKSTTTEDESAEIGSSSSETSKREILNEQLQQIDLLKKELQAKDIVLKEQQESHQSEVMAIQRVLADVTTEKMKLEGVDVSDIERTKEETNHKIQLLQMSNNLKRFQKEIEVASREANEKKQQIQVLESRLENAVEENKKLTAQGNATKEEMATLQNKVETLNSMEEFEAEISHQKLETEKLKVDKMEIQVALASALDEARSQKAENEVVGQEMKKLQQERDQAVAEAEAAKEEMKLVQQNVEKLKKEKESASNQLVELKKSKERAMSQVNKAINAAKATKAEHPMISPSNSIESDSGEDSKEIKEQANPGVSVEEFVQLQQTLSETTASLETSKKIIASLESANGSLAVDSRSKFKEKEEELTVIQKESDDRKRNLDSLATELRDLQRKQGDIENADRRTKVQLIRQKALMDHLESTLNELQEAVVVHESSVSILESGTSDNSNLEEISEILGDALHAITATLETSEQLVEEIDDSSDYDMEYADVSSEVGRHIDAVIRNDREAASQGLRKELDQKKVAVKRLEEALKKQNEDMRRMRSQFYNTDNSQMRTEIHRLRQQCSTNMEVLAKKERELSVLRSSLNVDENESGYISDDASDDEDEDDGTDVGSIMSAAKLNAYGPADAEAYATILSQANGRIGMPGTAQIQEIESLKRDLMDALGEKESASKELQARRESLANAKMIISSLEQANKGMMQDLRFRLQDSNTAISSLLNKSKQHENEADELREKLQKLEEEKLEERTKHEVELRKLRNEDGTNITLDEKKEDSS